MRLQRRRGRKLIIIPEGLAVPAPKPRRDDTLIRALVRAHRWRRLLPLSCLAPDIVAFDPRRAAAKGAPTLTRRVANATVNRPNAAVAADGSWAVSKK